MPLIQVPGVRQGLPELVALRPHLVQKHKRQDLMGAGKDVFTQFAVQVEKRKQEEGGKKDVVEVEEVEEVPTQPLERLSMVLRLNGIGEDIIRRVVSIFKLNPAWWATHTVWMPY